MKNRIHIILINRLCHGRRSPAALMLPVPPSPALCAAVEPDLSVNTAQTLIHVIFESGNMRLNQE